MAGQISDAVKQKRRKRIMAEQRKIARHVSQAFIGREIKVLVEGKADLKQLENASVTSWEHGFLRGSNARLPSQVTDRFLVARSDSDAPDIDGRVFIRGRFGCGQRQERAPHQDAEAHRGASILQRRSH